MGIENGKQIIIPEATIHIAHRYTPLEASYPAVQCISTSEYVYIN